MTDSTTTTTTTQSPTPAQATDLIGIAVAIGRIEEKQIASQATLNEVKATVGDTAALVASHSTLIAGLVVRVDGVDEKFKERAPVKNGWASIAAFIVAAIAVAASIVVPLLHP